MDFVQLDRFDNFTVVRLARGKVNAINSRVVDELSSTFSDLAADDAIDGVILTGSGKFFSFGFDIPELFDYAREDFTAYLRRFCALYHTMYLLPKPMVAAINGHAVAGGCILALTADYRIMAYERARIGLNEITLGASIFSGTVEMLRHTVGSRRADTVLLGGALYRAMDAKSMRLVDLVVPGEDLLARAKQRLAEFSIPSRAAFAELKRLLREPIVTAWDENEEESIERFVDIWYSPETRAVLKKVQIRG